MNFLSNIRNAFIANLLIVIFHIYIAFAVEGLDFLLIVLPVGLLITGAYYFKGRIGAALLAVPTIGYLLILPDLFEAISSEGGDSDIGWGVYILVPFWLLTIILNIITIFSESKKSRKSN
tara:strand:- start:4641 stop:5000 length:360 start_codon:yes stop_codon:yes gene_type:complete